MHTAGRPGGEGIGDSGMGREGEWGCAQSTPDMGTLEGPHRKFHMGESWEWKDEGAHRATSMGEVSGRPSNRGGWETNSKGSLEVVGGMEKCKEPLVCTVCSVYRSYCNYWGCSVLDYIKPLGCH